MKYWIYYLIAVALMFHPHLAQKIGMLIDYFTHPDYHFWTTFSPLDFFDLVLHAGLPLLFVIIGVKKQLSGKNA
jgi:hypothetical protein